MDVRLTRGDAGQRDVVARLLELNAYEFSRLDGRALDQHGVYGYRHLDAYWSEDGRVPYLISADGELAGLALVRRTGPVMSVAEFLVLPKFRRRGVGRRAARLLFAGHPGPWRVEQVAGHDAATAFWRRAITVPYEEEVGPDGSVVQSFTTAPPSSAVE